MGRDMYLTTVSEAELLYGVAIMPTGKRRNALEAAMTRWLDLGFRERILPFDSAAARAYAEIAAERRRAGPTNRRRRLPDRRHIPLTRSSFCHAQCAGLRGYGTECDQSLVGWSMRGLRLQALNRVVRLLVFGAPVSCPDDHRELWPCPPPSPYCRDTCRTA